MKIKSIYYFRLLVQGSAWTDYSTSNTQPYVQYTVHTLCTVCIMYECLLLVSLRRKNSPLVLLLNIAIVFYTLAFYGERE